MFLLFSQLSDMYDEEKCTKKWESFKYEHDASDMIYFLKKHDIEIGDVECSIIYVYEDAMGDKEFDKFRFTVYHTYTQNDFGENCG